jgi:hypothetical protein
MKKLFVGLFGLLFVALTFPGRAQSDEQMSRFLVGAWQAVIQQQVNGGTAHCAMDTVFFANGTFQDSDSWTFPVGSNVVVTKGTWSIAQGVLHVVYQSVEFPLYDNQTFDILGDGQQFAPFKNSHGDQVPAPADFGIHVLDANTLQRSDGLVCRRIAD